MSDRLPVVLLPGLLLTERLWLAQRTHLSDIAECIVPDLSRDSTVAAMAARVLDDAPPRFALAGLSMGGYVALEMMRQAPERIGRLALLNTSARPDSDEQLRRRRGLIELSEKGRFKGVTPRLLPLLIHADRQDDEGLTGPIFAMAEAVGRAGFVRQQKAIMGRVDSRPHLGAIACPTLIVCGRDDALTPVEVHQEMAMAIAGAELLVIDSCGHLPPMERPDAVNGALRAWLTR